jgi:hypothetical protein
MSSFISRTSSTTTQSQCRHIELRLEIMPRTSIWEITPGRTSQCANCGNSTSGRVMKSASVHSWRLRSAKEKAADEQPPMGCPYITRRSRLRPAGERSSLASSVPSLSGFAALKRFSTSAIYSSWLSVPS